MIPILIPAAGASRRMGGRDKLCEKIDGIPLLRRTAGRALETGAQVVITLPPAPHPRHDLLIDLTNITRLEVPDAAEGLSASLRRGLAALPDAQTVMILLADLPDLTTQDLCRVAQAMTQAPDHAGWRGATAQGAPGHPVVLGPTLLARIRTLRGDQGFAPLLRDLGDQVHLTPLTGQAARTDLDTPEAWDAWRAARSAPRDP